MDDNKEIKEEVKETVKKPKATKKSPKKDEAKAEGKTETVTEGKSKGKAEEKPVAKTDEKAESKSVTEAKAETNAETEAKAPTKTMAEKAIDRFAEMMVAQLEVMKDHQWEKSWTGGEGKIQGLPQNLAGERFYGHNDYFLQLHAAQNGYDTPVYGTYKQLKDAGVTINKGEKAMPILYWNTAHKDEQGNKISDEAYKAMTKEEQAKVKTVPVMMGSYVWNIQQTNFPEVKPELFAQLQEQFKLRDTNVEMYKDGMTHYNATAKDQNPAKEAFVSELTGAVVASSMGFDKPINNESIQHVDGWIDSLKNEPRTILSVVADVNKAAKQVLDHVDKQRTEQGLTPLQPKKESKEQTRADSQQQSVTTAKTIPLDQFNKLETEDGKKIDHFAVFKLKSGDYGVRAMVDGQQLPVKNLQKEDRNAFFEHTTTKAAIVQKYYGKELSQPKKEERSKSRSM